MNLIIFISVGIIILYGLSLLPPARSYQNIKPNKYSADPNEHSVSFSLIIPFRNEQSQIPSLIASLRELNYPPEKLEILFTDDHSEDESIALLQQHTESLPFGYRVISLTEGPRGKKAAIRQAVEAASNDIIITTDADCRFNPAWLNEFDRIFREDPAICLVAAPVRYMSQDCHPLLFAYQAMESAMLMALTRQAFGSGKALMANGANLSFRKDLYLKAEQMRNDGELPGGDDVFLLEAAAGICPGGAVFRNYTALTVDTAPEFSWASLWQQRTRWASKVRFQADRSALVYQTMAALVSLWYLFALGLLITGSGYMPALVMLGGKMLLDLAAMAKLLPACGYAVPVVQQTMASVVQPFFTLMVAARVLFGSYQWKGRTYKA